MDITKRDNFTIILFWMAIAYAAQWFNGVILMMTGNYVIDQLFASHTKPFVTFFFAGLIFFLSYPAITVRDIPKLASFKLLIVPLVFMIIEVIHFPGDYSLFKQFKYLFYSKLISSVSTGVILLFITEILIKRYINLDFILQLIYIITFKAIAYMLISAFLELGVIPIFINNLIFNSSQAYESLFVIGLILFCYLKDLDSWKKYALIYVNALTIFFFECRGACVIFIVVGILFLIDTLHKKNISKQILFLLSLSPLVFFSYQTITGAAPLGITTIYGLFQTKDASVESTIQKDDVKAKDQGQASSYINALAQYVSKKSDESGKKISPTYSDGTLRFEDDQNDAFSKEAIELDEKTLSAFSRTGTIILGLETFIQNPIIGIGSHNAYTLKVSGYGIHSLIPLVLASYGSIGILPLVVFYLFVAGKYTIKTKDLLTTIYISIFIGSLMMFDNSFNWMYALGVLFFCYANSDFRSRRPKTHQQMQTV